MNGETVRFAGNGHERTGYLSLPLQPGPVVIVLQEWWGLVGHIKSVADRFAEAGFVALAPDLYDGVSTTEPDEAGSLMMALNIRETEMALRGAIQYALEHPQSRGNRAGVVGFCMGGQLALLAATTHGAVGAAVNYYGIHPAVKPDFQHLNAPLMGHFAEHDAYASPEAVAAMAQELQSHDKAFEFFTYEGTHHAFFNDDRPDVFDLDAASLSWERTVAFFRTHLDPGFQSR